MQTLGGECNMKMMPK